MADKKPPPPNNYHLALQEKYMEQLELGEASAKQDWERIDEIRAERAARGETLTTHDIRRAEGAFHDFELRETARERNQPLVFEPKTPEREAAHDAVREPEIAQEMQLPSASDDLKQQHAEASARQPQEQDQGQQPEAGGKRLRFYEDLERDHAKALEKREESKEQGQGGEKKLTFFEDRNPSQGHGHEH